MRLDINLVFRVLTSQSKKKKPKKKKAAAAVVADDDESGPSTPGGKSKKNKGSDKVDPFAGMDEVDRALAELNMKCVLALIRPSSLILRSGGSSEPGPSAAEAAAAVNETRRFMTWRTLLSVDPKNLDADAELRRFFGSKVVSYRMVDRLSDCVAVAD